MNKEKLWILKRKKFLIISFFSLLFSSTFAFLTLPPSPYENRSQNILLAQAEDDFVKGNLNSAYKHLLLSSTLNEDPKWKDLYFLTLLGLEKPLSAISFLQEEKNLSDREKFYLETLLKREGVDKESPKFFNSSQIPLQKEMIKKVCSIIQDKDNIFLLTETSFYKMNSEGKVIETSVLRDGKDLLFNTDNDVVILTKNSIILKGEKIVLPLQINSAVSFANAPEGNYYVLDENNKLFMINASGNILQERQLLIKNCLKIRTDKIYRVFILSSKNEISVYSSSFEPLFVFDGNSSLTGLNGMKDFFVDYAGNPLILDKSGELFLFNFKQEFLGKSQKEKFKVDNLFWDGGDFLLVLDKRKLVLRKLEL